MNCIKGNVRFAVVGCGHIGKRHIEEILRHPEAELAAVCDILPMEALDISIVRVPFFSSLEKLLSSEVLFDVLCVCTPNGYHVEQTIEALKANKHVVCEKPFGLTTASCKAALSVASEVSRHIFCVMQNRYSPPSMWLKELLAAEKLGEIYMVQISCFWNRDQRYYSGKDWRGTLELDGGPLFTQFSHFIDILYWLFGDIKEIQANFYNFNHQYCTDFEDSGLISFGFIAGGAGSIQYTTSVWDKNLESSMVLIGSKGSVRIGGQYMNEVMDCHIQDYTMPTLPKANPANDYGSFRGSASNHGQVIDHLIQHLKGNDTGKTVSATDGMKVVEIIERIYSLK